MTLFKRKKIDSSHIKVSLKPLLGIKPEIYIPIIYAILLLSLLFILIILPGLLKNGTVTTITSAPDGASIYIDGIRVGSTPNKLFINKGVREIALKKSGFSNSSVTKNIDGKLLFSLFNQNKESIHFNLMTANGKDILEKSFSEMAEWSLVGKKQISDRFRVPPLLSQGVKNYTFADDFSVDELDNFLKHSAKLVTNEFILSDYLRSLVVGKSSGKMLTPGSLKDSIRFIDILLQEAHDVELLLYGNILESVEYDLNREQKLRDDNKRMINSSVVSYESSMADIKINNYNFKYVPKGEFTPVNTNHIHIIKEDSFYISETMVLRKDFYEFIKASPKWASDNYNKLIKDGLITENYLKEADNEYITNISYYAAKEWIEWANDNFDLPAGYKIALPSENMWYSAINYNKLVVDNSWQWTGDGFFIYDHFLTDENGHFLDEYSFVKPRVVVGKSNTNRGVQDASWCTPFLGIRMVLIEDQSGKK